MRTTINLPDDLHKQAVAIARDTSRTVSETIADLIRRGLGEEARRPAEVFPSPRTGLPVIRLGKVITSADVRALEDEE